MCTPACCCDAECWAHCRFFFSSVDQRPRKSLTGENKIYRWETASVAPVMYDSSVSEMKWKTVCVGHYSDLPKKGCERTEDCDAMTKEWVDWSSFQLENIDVNGVRKTVEEYLKKQTKKHFGKSLLLKSAERVGSMHTLMQDLFSWTSMNAWINSIEYKAKKKKTTTTTKPALVWINSY